MIIKEVKDGGYEVRVKDIMSQCRWDIDFPSI